MLVNARIICQTGDSSAKNTLRNILLLILNNILYITKVYKKVHRELNQWTLNSRNTFVQLQNFNTDIHTMIFQECRLEIASGYTI